MAKKKIVVGLAKVYSCYGGPEEGGWYYGAGEPIEGFRCRTFYRSEKAIEYRDHLAAKIEAIDRFPGVGVGGCGDADDFCRGEAVADGLTAVIQYLDEKEPGRLQPWPKVTPHYE